MHSFTFMPLSISLFDGCFLKNNSYHICRKINSFAVHETAAGNLICSEKSRYDRSWECAISFTKLWTDFVAFLCFVYCECILINLNLM